MLSPGCEKEVLCAQFRMWGSEQHGTFGSGLGGTRVHPVKRWPFPLWSVSCRVDYETVKSAFSNNTGLAFGGIGSHPELLRNDS